MVCRTTHSTTGLSYNALNNRSVLQRTVQQFRLTTHYTTGLFYKYNTTGLSYNVLYNRSVLQRTKQQVCLTTHCTTILSYNALYNRSVLQIQYNRSVLQRTIQQVYLTTYYTTGLFCNVLYKSSILQRTIQQVCLKMYSTTGPPLVQSTIQQVYLTTYYTTRISYNVPRLKYHTIGLSYNLLYNWSILQLYGTITIQIVCAMMAALNFMLLLYNVILFVCIRHLTYNFASPRRFQLCGHHRSYLDVYARHIIEEPLVFYLTPKSTKAKQHH